MAKLTLTIEDADDGTVTTKWEGDTKIEGDMTGAQFMGMLVEQSIAIVDEGGTGGECRGCEGGCACQPK